VFHPFAKQPNISFAENIQIDQWSIIDNDYQLIANFKTSSVQLFNLKADPMGKMDRAKDHGDITGQLFSKWEELHAMKSNDSLSIIDLDEQTSKQLEALGYVDFQDQMPNNPENPDGDDIPQDQDNCPYSTNPDQVDTDGDTIGDRCDNCPHIYNPQQDDADLDDRGDTCDDCIDTDWDGYGNPGYANRCVEDNCPYTFNPNQDDDDNDSIGDACEPAWFEHHWLEAEHTDNSLNQLEVGEDADASQERYGYMPNGTGNQYTPGPTMESYTVTLLKKGVYVLWGRVSAPSSKDDSFFIQVDDGLNNLWEVELGDPWHWDQVNNRNKTDPVKFILTEGSHTIKVKLREDGTKLDKLLLTNFVEFVPTGKGDLAEN
jgi:hypothetical protein